MEWRYWDFKEKQLFKGAIACICQVFKRTTVFNSIWKWLMWYVTSDDQLFIKIKTLWVCLTWHFFAKSKVKFIKIEIWYVSCAAHLIHFIRTVYGSDQPVDGSLACHYSHIRHLLATQIVRWPRRIGRVQLDQPLADCRQPNGASSRLYEPGYIVLEEERTDLGPGIDRVVCYDILLREGPGGARTDGSGVGHTPGVTRTCEGCHVVRKEFPWAQYTPVGDSYL